MKSFEKVCPSEFINRVAQYEHMLTGRMHTFFNFTCLLISFTRYFLQKLIIYQPSVIIMIVFFLDDNFSL